MAIQKNKKQSGTRGGRGKAPKTYSWTLLFWLAFAILILGLFIVNREVIGRSIQIIQNEFSASKSPEEQPPPPLPPPLAEIPEAVSPQQQAPPAQTPALTPENTQAQSGQAPPAEHVPGAAQGSAAELRDRSLYFIVVDRDGSILRVRVDRSLPVSGSPMTDTLQALLAGPSGDEINRGLITLIPPDTRILSASVRDNTAFISFSEDFQYNTYGVEGYAAQLRQVVLTVTEFPNITDVQILIEGRRIDFLGEGIWIGSPISREML